jgi:hypothetical protein
MNALESLGNTLGTVFSPLTFIGSHLRQARLFHPTGELFQAEVDSDAELVTPLKGSALVRISTSLWKKGLELPDAWGCAIRFGWTPEEGAALSAWHQDLIFASFKRLIELPISPLTSRGGDFTQNVLYSVVPSTWGPETVRFRLEPENSRYSRGINRWERLAAWQESGRAELTLYYTRFGFRDRWRKLARVRLLEKVEMDQNLLGFSPFHDGMGIRPAGLVNHIRRATYSASQRARAKFLEKSAGSLEGSPGGASSEESVSTSRPF